MDKMNSSLQTIQKVSALILFLIAVLNLGLALEFGMPPLVFGLVMLFGSGFFLNLAYRQIGTPESKTLEMGASIFLWISAINVVFFVSIITALSVNFYQSTLQVIIATILFAFFSFIFWGVIVFIFVFLPVWILAILPRKPARIDRF